MRKGYGEGWRFAWTWTPQAKCTYITYLFQRQKFEPDEMTKHTIHRYHAVFAFPPLSLSPFPLFLLSLSVVFNNISKTRAFGQKVQIFVIIS